ncbi:MAG: Protein of unknown function DUF484 [Burkholderiaceae bacterium]|jgi:uncharacterized protein YigA (DUF484 family)|nr:MAG: Protein of unknown function DUF484 [Burkholderiaceae bacterium]
MKLSPMNPITEDDIANYLVNTPDFFERHAQLLATVQLTSPHGNRAVSLQERQAEMLRDKIRALEQRIMEMIRNGSENVVIADRLQQWTRELFLAPSARELPQRIVDGLKAQFVVPQAAIRVWDVAPAFEGESFAQGVSGDAKIFASSLTTPYCGVNAGFEAVGWLPDPVSAQSLVLIPLRTPGAQQAFGLVVLASPDSQRFHSTMGTDFLERIAELAGAALSRLR